MTTGAPIYLVSACASGEEFVSAFRRYADRNGVVFIPIAQPLPPGRKGRFALTLKDGGVMVEGEAEVVSSARTPSVLYGRVGMTLKFTEPDDPSKTMLGELEKARLAMKPAAPSVAPRPADVPAEPRPTPPAPSGRIDAVNALAECVAIGDLTTLGGDDLPPKMGAKFVVPSIPAVGGAPRPKSPSVPPPPVERKASTTGNLPVIPKQPLTPTSVPIVAPPAAALRAPTPSAPLPAIGKETVMGMPALERAPAGPATPVTATPAPGTPIVAAPPAPAPSPPPAPAPEPEPPPSVGKATVMGMQMLERPPAVLAATEPREDPTMPTPARVAAAAAAVSRDKNDVLQTVRGPAPGVDLVTPNKKIDLNETMRGPAPKPATPPTPTPPTPTPPTPTPTVRPGGTAPPPVPSRATPPGATPVVQRPPAAPAPPIVAAAPEPIDDGPDDADEDTDLTELPLIPVDQVGSGAFETTGRTPRRTVIGVAVVPSGVHVLPAAPPRPTEEEVRDTSVMAVPDEPSGPVMITSTRPIHDPPPIDPHGVTMPAEPAYRPAGPNIEESTPSGDWTMTPGEHGPTIAPRAPASKIELPDADEGAPIKQIPPGPPTGDWMIALDPSQPDGWSEPSKVVKRPAGELPPGPPVSAVSSDKDLDSDLKAAAEPKAADAEPKVQVDPTLIEPLTPLQPLDDFDDEPAALPPPRASVPLMPAMQGASQQMSALPGAIPTPVPGTMHTPVPGTMHTPVPGTLHTPVPGTMHTPMPMQQGAYLTPIPGMVTLANASGQVQAYPQYDSSPAMSAAIPSAAARKRRLIVIGVSAGVALLLVIVLALALGGGKKGKSKEDPGTGTDGSAMVTAPPVDAKASETVTPVKQPDKGSDKGSDKGPDQALVQPAPPDAAEVAAPPADAAVVAVATECEVEVMSTPPGADIVLDKNVVGQTPTKLKLPCGVESDLAFKKARFVTGERAVTPKAEGQKPVRITLAKVSFTVKVSSSPPGATILLGAKSLGITPAAIKLPAFETSTLKLTKDGYSPDLQKITPKTNNLSISSTLKKLVKKGALR